MRIVIDLQACQSGSRFRGISRYSMSLVQAMARNPRGHEIWLALNNSFPETIEPIRKAFLDLIPQSRIVAFSIATPVDHMRSENAWRIRTSEKLREQFLYYLKPDILYITSIFEGWGDNSVMSIGELESMCPVAATFYDLIPFQYQNTYLPDQASKDYYFRKLNFLKRADVLLAISESSRQDAISLLNIKPERTYNISAAVGNQFQRCPGIKKESEAENLSRKYGIDRPFVLYVPGGFDWRKNFESLIEGYSRLPFKLRSQYQLVIVSHGSEPYQNRLLKLASNHGLKAQDLVFTGYVADEDLITLYRTCSLFIFPSLYEGFGLPVLEAMACGAPVIGSNISSIPEVIDLQDALFDPRSVEDVCQSLYRALTDQEFRNSLIEHAAQQSAKFSWDKSAELAWDALEKLHKKYKSETKSSPSNFTLDSKKKPQLAIIPSLIFVGDELDDFLNALIKNLSLFYNVTLVSYDFDSWDHLPNHGKAAGSIIEGVNWLKENYQSLDYVIYEISELPSCHKVLDLLAEYPGIAILKDFHLGDTLKWLDDQKLAFTYLEKALYFSHGFSALVELKHFGREYVAKTYPCNRQVFDRATGILLVSQADLEAVRRWYGESIADQKCSVVPSIMNASQDTCQQPDKTTDNIPDTYISQQYYDAIESLTTREHQRYRRLLEAISTNSTPISPSELDLLTTADAIARNMPSAFTEKQLLVDVSELVQRDSKSGIQRVVRSVLLQLLTSPPHGYRTEPVFFDGKHYRYAHSFTQRLIEVNPIELGDDIISVQKSDIFFGLDLYGYNVNAWKIALSYFHRIGVEVYFVVYDILAMRHPEWWPADMYAFLRTWLSAITEVSDGIICISRSVAEDVEAWITENPPQRLFPIRISHFHLGADIENSVPTQGMPENAEATLKTLKARPTFLMVGTIEPRKGHAQALSAFERLWKEGQDVNLVLVGKQGWLVEFLVERLNQHPQLGKRLFWLQGISDEYLDAIYSVSTALIAASEGEGFGLPVIEAAQRSLPIIARDLLVFREVAGEHAYYFQGMASKDLAKAVKSWLALYQQGAAPDPTQISWLTWEESTQQILEVLLNSDRGSVMRFDHSSPSP